MDYFYKRLLTLMCHIDRPGYESCSFDKRSAIATIKTNIPQSIQVGQKKTDLSQFSKQLRNSAATLFSCCLIHLLYVTSLLVLSPFYRRNFEGDRGRTNVPSIFFLPKNIFFGYWVDEGKIKKYINTIELAYNIKKGTGYFVSFC
jgi:hypothetical protein